MHDDHHGVDYSIQLEPLEPDAPLPSRRRPVWLYALVAAAVVMSGSVVALLLVKLPAIIDQHRMDLDVAVAVPRDGAELRSESTRVLSEYDASGSHWAQLPPAEQQVRAEIVTMFDQLQQHIAAGDHDQVRELVDFDRLVKRIELTGYLRGWTQFDKRRLRSELRGYVDAEVFLGNLQVAGIITPPDDSRSRVVYLLSNHEDTDETESRFWIGRSAEGWKIYDWERLDLGLSTSREWGLYCKYAGSPAMDGYQRWAELVGESDALQSRGDVEAAKEKLRQAEAQQVPHELSDYVWVLTAYQWTGLDESENAIRCAKNVNQPSRIPGAYYTLMLHHRWSDDVEALKQAELYEASVGPCPDLLEIKAELLEQLSRPEEAADEWRKLLRFRPADTRALVSCLAALPDENKSAFEPQLAQLDDPMTTVIELVSPVANCDYPGLLFLVDYLKRTAADHPAAKHAAGLVHFLDGDYQQAADLYRAAYEAEGDTDARQPYVESYVEVMVELGQVVAAVEAIPDPKATLENLFYQYDEAEIELTEEEHRALVEWYAARFPDEFDAFDRRVALAMKENRFAEAEKLARAALEKMPPPSAATVPDEQGEFDETAYYRDSFETSLAAALDEQGQLNEAYESVGDRKERFAQLTRRAIADDRWDDVRELLAMHRANEPEDPELYFVEGEIAADQERWDEAVAKFQAGIEAAGDESPWYRNYRFRQMCIQGGTWETYYTSHPNMRDAFEELAHGLIAEKQWSALDELIQTHSRGRLGDHVLELFTAKAAWEKKDYQEYIYHAKQALRTEDDEVLSNYERREVQQRLISAHVRSQPPTLVRHRLRELLRDFEDDPQLLAIVHAASGQMIHAKQSALEAATQDGDASELYNHEDTGHVFLGSSFRELQQKFPVELPYEAAPTLAVVLSGSVPELEAANVTSALKHLGVDAPVEALDTSNAQVIGAFAVGLDNSRVWIATGGRKSDDDWAVGDEESPLAAAVNGHQAWLAVGTARWAAPAGEQADRLARDLAAELAGEDATAICARRRNRWESYALFAPEPALIESWRELGDLNSLGNAVEEVESWGGSNDVVAQRSFTQALRKAVREFEQSADPRLVVWVRLSTGPAIEPLELKITSIGRSYGSLEFDGTLNKPSTLLPGLQTGLPMRVGEYEIVAWQLNDNGVVFRP